MDGENRSCCGFISTQKQSPKSDNVYHYTSIGARNDIRVLVLEAGNLGDPLVCSLPAVSFTSRPIYEALSYTWGVEEPIDVLYAPGSLAIRPNLHAALQRLRYPQKSRTLWVDAVCINQENPIERDQQVTQMKIIYSEARNVIVWLGEEGIDNVKVAFETIGLFEGEDPQALGEQAVYEDSFAARLGHPRNNPRLKALSVLFKRPWFRRVWIIQEVALARSASVLCGALTCSWDALEQLVKYLSDNNAQWVMENQTRWVMFILQIRQSIQSINEEDDLCSLILLLFLTRDWEATVPHDKVYSLLGLGALIEAEAFEGLDVDYNSSCETLYATIAAQSFRLGSPGLALLGWAGCNEGSKLKNLPSWVPDWTLGSTKRLGVNSLRTGWFRAGGSIPEECSVSEDQKVLSIKGWTFDTISEISDSCMPTEVFPLEGESKEACHHRLEMQRIEEYERMSASCLPYVSEEWDGDWSVIWPKLYVCGHATEYGGRGQEPPSEFYIAGYKAKMLAHNDIENVLAGRFSPEFELHREAVTMYERVQFALLPGRRYCSTSKKYLGWVPHAARRGDVVCVFRGEAVPYLLRATGDDHYKLIGECYIQGIMDGEFMDDIEDADSDDEGIDIKIC